MGGSALEDLQELSSTDDDSDDDAGDPDFQPTGNLLFINFLYLSPIPH